MDILIIFLNTPRVCGSHAGSLVLGGGGGSLFSANIINSDGFMHTPCSLAFSRFKNKGEVFGIQLLHVFLDGSWQGKERMRGKETEISSCPWAPRGHVRVRRSASHRAQSSITFSFSHGNEKWSRGCTLENAVWVERLCAPCGSGVRTLAMLNSPRLFPSNWLEQRQCGVWPWEPVLENQQCRQWNEPGSLKDHLEGVYLPVKSANSGIDWYNKTFITCSELCYDCDLDWCTMG